MICLHVPMVRFVVRGDVAYHTRRDAVGITKSLLQYLAVNPCDKMCLQGMRPLQPARDDELFQGDLQCTSPTSTMAASGLEGAVRLESLERVATVCSDFAEGTAVIAARPTVAPSSSTNPLPRLNRLPLADPSVNLSLCRI